MSKTKAFLIIAGTAACLCWGITNARADQQASGTTQTTATPSDVGQVHGGFTVQAQHTADGQIEIVGDVTHVDADIQSPIPSAEDAEPRAPGNCALCFTSGLGGGTSTFCQPFNNPNFGTARTCDEELGLEVLERFTCTGSCTELPNPITRIEIWIISLEFNGGFVGSCNTEDNTTAWNIRTYADGINATTPGTLLSTRVVVPTSVVDTGVNFALGATVRKVTFVLPTPICNLNVKWLGMQRQTGNDAASGNGCVALWVDERTAGVGDDYSRQNTTNNTTDQTLCVATAAAAINGSCCNPTNATIGAFPAVSCTDNVPLCNCSAVGLIFNSFNCASYSPPCGQGACCHGASICSVETQANCTTLGGYAFHLGSTCVGVDCTPPPPNDTCVTKSAASPLMTGASGSLTYNTANANTANPLSINCGTGVEMHQDIWWDYVVPAPGGRLVISTIGSSYDPVVAAYLVTGAGTQTAICNDILNSTGAITTQLACNDDIDPGVDQASYLQMNVTTGQNIKVRAGGFEEGQAGAGVLNWDIVPAGSGRCCYPNGTCLIRTQNQCTVTDSPRGFYSEITSFYEGNACVAGGTCQGPGGLEFLAIGCKTVPCPANGEACWKAINLFDGGIDGVPGGSPDSGLFAGTGQGTNTVSIINKLYYKYTLFDNVVIDSCGSDFDTIIQIYSGCDNVTGQLVDVTDGSLTQPVQASNDDCNGLSTSIGATTFASCMSSTETTSCLCIDVQNAGPGSPFEAGNTIIIVVGAFNPVTGTQFDGIDPEPNDVNPQAVSATLKVTLVSECYQNCQFPQVCPGDTNLDAGVSGKDIQKFVDLVLSNPSGTNPDCGKADMNGDSHTDVSDVPLFVSALLGKFGCTPLASDCTLATRCQFPDQGGHGCDRSTGRTSDSGVGFTVADNFSSPDGGLLSNVCWWGFYVDFAVTGGICAGGAPTDSFTITYFNDNAGVPGTVFAGPFEVTATRTLTGDTIGTRDEYRYTATHATLTVAKNQCLWIQIVNATTPDTCNWLWEAAGPGDGKAYQSGVIDHDLSFCVNIPVYVNACGNVACTITCTGTSESELACDNPSYVNTNEGCDALSPTIPPASTNLGNLAINGSVTACGKTGTHSVNSLPCLTTDDCPGTDTCNSGFCSNPPYLVNDFDWYRYTLTAPAYLIVTTETETPLFIFLAVDTPASLDCNTGPTLGYFIEPSCSSVGPASEPHLCVSDTLAASGGGTFPAQTHLFLVGPNSFVAPCASDYRVTLTATSTPPAN